MNTKLSNEAFEVYSRLKKQIADLETQTEALKPALLEEIKLRTADMEEQSLKFKFGTFSITTRKTWNYSEDVKLIEESLKDRKHLEEEQGVAKFKATESLRYQE